ncbi:MAG: LysR substrate-binding domain-containing protein [Gammaproteobacteria bacterium]|nr:LysR substrate-binding domain-containing protein [Gammaproteobacteria bacterium]
MNLRDLEYVIAVAETHHFGKAATRCYVSQPTLSGQIKKLEEQLGVVIFERTNRSVEITPIGEKIISHARLILEQADAIKQLAQASRDPLAGVLRIGAIPTLSPYLMPLILLPFKKAYPQLKLALSEEITDTLLARLRNHEIDAALIATNINENDLVTVALFDEPFWLAHPRDIELYNKDEISQEDLDELDLLLLSDGHCLAKQVMDVCKTSEHANQSEFADMRAASLETLLQLVSAGFGSTLVPALATRGSWTTGSGIIARPLSLPNASRRVSLVYRQSFPRQQAIQAFVNTIMSNLPNTVKKIKTV